LRCDAVNPPLLGMSKVVSEDALRRALAKIDETAGMQWLQAHLDYCVRPLLDEPWVLDVDATISRSTAIRKARWSQTGAAVALLSQLVFPLHRRARTRARGQSRC
jgi:hypothetical protein